MKHTFTANRTYSGRDRPKDLGGPVPTRYVKFEIAVDIDALLDDKGGKALGKSRRTTVADGAIVITATEIEEAVIK